MTATQVAPVADNATVTLPADKAPRVTRPAVEAPRVTRPAVEAPRVSRPATRARRLPNLAGPTVLAMAAGLVLQASAVARSRAGDLGAQTQWLFWLGMLVVFVPAAFRIIARQVSAAERITLTVALPIALQFERLVLFPTNFAFHDEFIHATTARLITESHHLFGANSVLPVSSFYPGTELATTAVSALTGLSTHTSAFIVLLLARLVLTLSVLCLISSLTGSTRAGCIASLIYTCNPQGVFFNAQFSYQSFALPLAFFTVYALITRRRDTSFLRAMTLPVLALSAVVMSHHLTSMLLVISLLLWFALPRVVSGRRDAQERRALLVMAAVGMVEISAWTALPRNPILGYLRDIVTSSVTDIKSRLTGTETHQLFHSSGGLVSPLWERVATIASILIVFLAILPTVTLFRRWRNRRQALLVMLGAVALLYPVIPLGHLTPGTGEVTDRTAGFLFVGVGLAIAQGPVFRARPSTTRIDVPIATALLTVVFAGGVILGAGPTIGQLPGPFLVAADARSIDAANLAAARWERAHLPHGTRVYADRDSGLLAAATGELHTVTHVADDIDASRVLLAPTFTAADRALIRKARISYVIVDERDATGLPNEQVYIESGEFGGDNRTTPVPLVALTKLSRVPGVTRVYTNGPIVIYDVRALR